MKDSSQPSNVCQLTFPPAPAPSAFGTSKGLEKGMRVAVMLRRAQVECPRNDKSCSCQNMVLWLPFVSGWYKLLFSDNCCSGECGFCAWQTLSSIMRAAQVSQSFCDWGQTLFPYCFSFSECKKWGARAWFDNSGKKLLLRIHKWSTTITVGMAQRMIGIYVKRANWGELSQWLWLHPQHLVPSLQVLVLAWLPDSSLWASSRVCYPAPPKSSSSCTQAGLKADLFPTFLCPLQMKKFVLFSNNYFQ